MTVIVVLAWGLAALLLACVAYRAIFSLAYLLLPARPAEARPGAEPARFAVVVPAHDEELLIGEVIRTIRAADYDPARIDVHVIADNCTDDTAGRVRALGETVHERHAPDHRGKGQAIDWLLGRLDLAPYDAVVLFDADNLVDPCFFDVMSCELASGQRCLQGYYGISNPGDSVMTRLLAVTYVMKNLLFNAGKARLGLSVVLMGTGMVFRREVLERHGWQAMSIGEDLEQTFCLLEAGETIRFVPEALTLAQEASSLQQGYTQRQRWATGRRDLYPRARRSMAEGIRKASLHRFDSGLELLLPTYSKLLNWTVLGALGAALLYPFAPGLLVAVGIALAYQVAEVAVAMWLMKADGRFVASLVFAPVFLVWKAAIDLLAVVGHRRDAWTRTDRAPHPEAADPDADGPAAVHPDP